MRTDCAAPTPASCCSRTAISSVSSAILPANRPRPQLRPRPRRSRNDRQLTGVKRNDRFWPPTRRSRQEEHETGGSDSMRSIAFADFLIGVGILFVLEGLMFAASPAWMRRAMKSALATPDNVLRAVGIGSAVVGLILIWVIRRPL